MDIARLGYAVDTTDVKAAGTDIDEFAGKNVKASKSADKLGSSSRKAGVQAKAAASGLSSAGAMAGRYGTRVGGAAGHTANLTAQLNDIGVMLAAGQNPMQLAMQQGTQVNQVFAQLGGGANAVRALGSAFVSMISPLSLLTIGVIAGGAALVQWGLEAVRATGEADKFAEKLEEIAERADAARQSLRADLRGTTADELVILDSIAAKERELAALRQEADDASAGRTRRNANLRVVAAQEAIAELQGRLTAIQQVEDARERLIEKANREADAERLIGQQMIDAARARAVSTVEAQRALTALNRQAQLAQVIARYGADSAQATALRVSQEREANAELVRGMNISESLKQELLNAWEAARGIAGTNISGTIDTATASASQLAAQLGIAYSTAVAIKNVGGGGATGPDDAISQLQGEGRIGGVLSGVVGTLNVGPSIAAGRGVGGGAGGGGVSLQDQYAEDLEALVESLRTEREIVELWYAEGEALLQNRRAQELLGAQDHKEQMLRLEEEYHTRIAQIDEASGQSRLQQTATVFGALAGVAEAGGTKLAKAAATLGGIEATINAYRAANQALADPSIPFVGKFAAYAAVLATGLRAVQSIRSAGGTSSGSTSGTALSATAAETATQEPQRVTLRGLNPKALFTGEMIQELFDELFDENNTRGGVFVVSS